MSGIRATENSKKFYARCGLCNEDFKTKSGCDRHFRSEKHLLRLHRWYELNGEGKYIGDWDANAKEVIAEEQRQEVVSFD